MLLQLALRVHTLRPFATAVGDATPCVAETRVVVGNGALLTLNLSSFGTETSTLQKAASTFFLLPLLAPASIPSELQYRIPLKLVGGSVPPLRHWMATGRMRA